MKLTAVVLLVMMAVQLAAMPAISQDEGPSTAVILPNGELFDPAPFLDQGDAFNCPIFANQAQAQAVLRAHPTDSNRLDADGLMLAQERSVWLDGLMGHPCSQASIGQVRVKTSVL